MKEKILAFIIGLLVGAIITTSCFYIYSKSTGTKIPNSEFREMKEGMHQGEGKRDFQKKNIVNEEGERPELPDEAFENGERPELPDDVGENEERPELPNDQKQDGELSTKKSKSDSAKSTTTNEV